MPFSILGAAQFRVVRFALGSPAFVIAVREIAVTVAEFDFVELSGGTYQSDSPITRWDSRCR